MADVLLHGDLELLVVEASNLPNKDMFTERLRRCFNSCGVSLPFRSSPQSPEHYQQHQHSETHIPKVITSDPYVTVRVAGATVARTQVISNQQNPRWMQLFQLPLAHRTPLLEFHVKDNDVFGAQLIGTATVPAGEVAGAADWIDKRLQILGPSGKPLKHKAVLHVKLRFTPFEKIPEDQQRIAGNPQKLGVPGTYFPLRQGGSVTLYQDAHVKENELPEIKLEGGRLFRQEACWEDICQTILEAHRLIYIVGWSIYDKVKLVRGPPGKLPTAAELTLGELLKYKSEEGVRVCLLVWDDKTSHDTFLVRTEGVMQTHDEDTRKFFKHSSVICILCPRYPSNKLSMFKQKVVGTIYSHHQKCVLADTQASPNKRKITAFIGGLDLCKGRYDTPEHRLFSDLDTGFLDDFYNPTFPQGTRGPRQPWHDMHCKIEGPAAYDVLKNFEQRWRMATKQWAIDRFKPISYWKDDALLKLERISWILSPSPTVPEDDRRLWVSSEEDSESWDVQIFRSIDSGSVAVFPKGPHHSEDQHLIFRKNVAIDRSIHTAYVRAIRAAEHFIYIENQYFIGSSYGWPDYKSPGADNLIPMELALKIASKIRAGKRFAVYIVIPMRPEGPADSSSVKEILYWQGQTIKMMYKIVGQELKSMNMKEHPQDYLNFYCLGKREELPNQLLQPSNQPSEKNKAAVVALSQKFQRFMIYVHAKGMIVDDEYVILGSANINQRSLDGSRDTEIAMGAYQPHHTWIGKQRHPRGQVYGHRMSLWAEHLGMLNPCFEEPQSEECVKFVNKIAEENWVKYTVDQVIQLQGHLITYPIKVEADGSVGQLPGQESFPDVGGKILGEHLAALPDELTM
ncbi:Phospholipase D delta [Apostasia shenzhenica]|uniref:Phospholipase D n=1 Tax=Apostasia shenzhenica TaxID=1088818 RepID=A0A2I0AF73_9ASPA|nr:Phospholipase D delta [Apostasia shenzhenica]